MTLLRKLIFSVTLVFGATMAFAGNQQNVLVTSMQAGQGAVGSSGLGAFLMGFAANSINSASCVVAGGLKWFAIDPTTAQGRAAISLALTAYSTGKTVTVIGAGTCNAYSGIEDVSYLYTTG
jgi:hypothetical protein